MRRTNLLPDAAAAPTRQPARRLILLGASNLTRGISTVVATAGGYFNPPLEILAAHGHGRSYGLRSRVLGRSLPGIVQCGLWTALETLPPGPAYALVTDIGNDLLYGVDADRVAQWVRLCLERCARHAATVVMTHLPLCNARRMTPSRFRFFRTLLFPSCGLTLADLLRQAERLDGHLRELAEEFGVATREPSAEWYGWDPIHIRLRHWRKAWPEILSPWFEKPAKPPRPAFGRWLYLRSRRAEEVSFLGLSCGARQPSARWADGSTYWCF